MSSTLIEISNNIDVRANNARKIIMALRNSPPVTKKDLADSIGLSLPTITNICKVLAKHDYISECGSVDSYVGRKPALISLNKCSRLSVGVSISTHLAAIAIVDFGGEILYQDTRNFPYSGTKAYWTKLARYIDSILEESGVDITKIVGVRIAMPHVFDPDCWLLAGLKSRPRGMVSYSEIPTYFKYKTDIITASEAAGIPRFWYGNIEADCVVVLLSRYVEGCIVHRDPSTKAISTKICPLGHMTLKYDGDECFCGKRGCFQTYCSTSRIVDMANGLDTLKHFTAEYVKKPIIYLDSFFAGVEEGNEEFTALWDDYLDKLSYAIHNLRLLFRSDIIICGEISSNIAKYKKVLIDKIDSLSNFKDDVDGYLHTSSLAKYDTCVGAALSLCDSILIDLFE